MTTDNPLATFHDNGDLTLAHRGAIVWRTSKTQPLVPAPFRSALVWKAAGAIVAGGGNSVMFLAMNDGKLLEHSALEGYFGSAVVNPQGDELLVLSATSARLFNNKLRMLWRSESLAVDGLILTQWESGVLHLEAELDPPGGWQPLAISVKTGRKIPQ